MTSRLALLRKAALCLCGVFCATASTAPLPTPTPSTFRNRWDAPIQYGTFGKPAGATPTGAALDGFALSLVLQPSTIGINQRIQPVLELRNVSGRANSTPFTSLGSTYTFTVVNQRTHRRNTFAYRSDKAVPDGYSFAPDTSLFLTFSFDLSLSWLNDFGAFTIQAKIKAPNLSQQLQSQSVSVNVLPRRQQPLVFDNGDPSTYTPAGAPAENLALSLAPTEPPANFGDPVYVTLELRNLSDKQQGIIVGLGPLAYDFSIVNRDTGQVVARIPGEPNLHAVTGLLGSGTLLQRRSAYWRVRLDQLYQITRPGTYLVKVTKASLRVNGTGDNITLQSNTAAVRISPLPFSAERDRQATGIFEDTEGDSPTGAPSHGFVISLTTDVSSAPLGAPLTVTVELRNVSGRPQYAFFGSRDPSYDFAIRNPTTGQILASPHPHARNTTTAGLWKSSLVYPGTSVYGTFRLDSLYRFPRAGTYKVSVAGHPIINGVPVTLRSNTIAITIR